MGCIEIIVLLSYSQSACLSNRNMGCIEIRYRLDPIRDMPASNRNMGCIEIGGRPPNAATRPGLTETWDVLKY